MIGVYMILNKINNKYYIGSSIDIHKRWKQHIAELNKGVHNNAHLQNAWDKYGSNNFDFIVVEETDINNLRERESYYIKKYDCINNGYNLLNDANIGLGVKASAEIREKISKACSGNKNGNYGRKRSEKEIKFIRDRRWGENYVCKPRKKYKKVSEEQKLLNKKKASERMKNRVVSDETKQKLSKSKTGTHHSEETKLNMSKNRKGCLNANCKLTREQVFEIYEKMTSGVNYKIICEEYGIGQCLAYKIKRKEHWAFNDT